LEFGVCGRRCVKNKNRGAMQDMMSVLKEFLRELNLNVNKSKIFVFNRKSRDKKEK